MRWKTADAGASRRCCYKYEINFVQNASVSALVRARIKDSRLMMWAFVMEVVIVSVAADFDWLGLLTL